MNKTIERVSIECLKPKPKLLLWPITRDGDNPVNQSKIEVITRSQHKGRENAGARARNDWFWFYFWLVEKVARELWTNHSKGEVMQNQSNSLITFDTIENRSKSRLTQMLVFDGNGQPKYAERILFLRRLENRETLSSHDAGTRESNPGHFGGGRMFWLLQQPYSSGRFSSVLTRIFSQGIIWPITLKFRGHPLERLGPFPTYIFSLILATLVSSSKHFEIHVDLFCYMSITKQNCLLQVDSLLRNRLFVPPTAEL